MPRLLVSLVVQLCQMPAAMASRRWATRVKTRPGLPRPAQERRPSSRAWVTAWVRLVAPSLLWI